MPRVKRRMTLSLDDAVAQYLGDRAAAETGGNVSALVERIIRADAVAESARQHAEFFAGHPGYFTDAEAERHATGAA
jgi:hypothetical protein